MRKRMGIYPTTEVTMGNSNSSVFLAVLALLPPVPPTARWPCTINIPGVRLVAFVLQQMKLSFIILNCGFQGPGPRPGPLPAAQRNAGIWPQSGAGRRKSGSRFLKKRGSNCDLSAYIVCVCSLCIPCLPSAPVLSMLAVLATLVTAWVFYQINMLG